MSDDVLITPASRKIEFKDSGGNIDGVIQLDSSGNLVLTSTVGLLIGDLDADIHIGDGSSVVDMVFDWSGSIYSVANKDLTIGKSSLGGNDVIIDSPNWSVTSAGNVGIGTTSPISNLHISATQPRLYLSDSDEGTGTGDSLLITKSGTISYIYDRDASSKLYLGANDDSDILVIDGANARVGIGTTSPASELQVAGSILVDYALAHSGDSNNSIVFTTDTQTFNTNGGPRITIKDDGRVGIGTTTPDETLHVKVTSSDSGPIAKFERDGQTGRVYIGSANAWGNIWTDDSVLSLGVSGDYSTDGSLIISGSDVGIGTDSPSAKLDVDEVADGIGLRVRRNDSSTSVPLVKFIDDSTSNDGPSVLEIQNDVTDGLQPSLMISGGSISLKEQANAPGDTGAYGQLWVKTATPNQLYFTTGAGNDIQLTSGTSIAGGGGGAVDSIANFSNNRVLTASDADSINGEANLTFDGTTLDVPTLTVDNINGDVLYSGTAIHVGLLHLGMGGVVPHSMTASGNSSRLAIEYESTVGTVNGHIALVGDSATVGQGPQILFSESGDGQGYVGGTIGFARTGSNSMGDLIFSTRQSSGNTATTATESMRIVGGTSPKTTFTHPVESTGNAPNYNLWEKVTFGKLDYGTAAGGGAGLSSLTFDDDEAGFSNFIIPTDITIRAVQIRTNGVVLATHANKAANQVLRIFANGHATSGTLMDISYTMNDFTRQDSENANATAHYVTFIGSTVAATSNQFAAGDTMSVRRNSGGYDMGDYIVHIWYSHDAYN